MGFNLCVWQGGTEERQVAGCSSGTIRLGQPEAEANASPTSYQLGILTALAATALSDAGLNIISAPGSGDLPQYGAGWCSLSFFFSSRLFQVPLRRVRSLLRAPAQLWRTREWCRPVRRPRNMVPGIEPSTYHACDALCGTARRKKYVNVQYV